MKSPDTGKNEIKMKKKEFASMFNGYKVPKELKSLYEFQKSEGVPSYYSNAFYLLDEENEILKSFSTEEKFLQSFLPFAEANSVGSVYAFWIKDKSIIDLETCPIVIFGDEGGVFVVAQNLNELLQIAAYDIEAVVYPDDFFYSDKEELDEEGEYVAAEFYKEYLDWLRSEAKLKPILTIEAVDAVVNEAQDRYGNELETLMSSFN